MRKQKQKLVLMLMVVALLLIVFGVAACGGGDEQQKEAQQAPQQEPTQQEAAQSSPKTVPSSDLAGQGLIGTWELSSIEGNPFPEEMGTENITFSDNGTFELQSTDPNVPDANTSFMGEYSVLDDSRIQVSYPDGTSEEQEYSLDDDTLTLLVEGVSHTYQRAG
jgi:hypothetical protein